MFLCLKLTTITHLNFLLVLYFWSSYCRCLKKLLIKWAHFINKRLHLKTNEEAVCLAVLFFYVLTRHTNTITDKGFSVFDGCTSRCVNQSPQEEELQQECNSSSWGESKVYTSGSIASSQRMPTEINESGAIAKIRISVEILSNI